MSEAVRSYSAGKGRPLLLRARGRGRRIVSLGLSGLMLFALYGLWVSRDTHALGEFIEEGQQVELHLEHPLDRRAQIAESPLWNAFPETHLARSIPELLRKDWGMSEWILRNVVGSEAFVFAKTVEEEDSFLFLTRMSHVGVVTERIYRRFPAVQNDKAGGLGLRLLREENLYYAVRGRILLASPSRKCLIQALTLKKGARAHHWHRPERSGNARVEDISGVIRFTSEAEISMPVESVGFALRFDEATCAVRFRTTLGDEFSRSFSALFENARPGKLRAPYPGPLQVSADFGLPVRDLFLVLSESLDWPQLSPAHWEQWEQGPEGTIGPVLTNLTGDAGSHVSVTWRGMDLHEALPIPELAFVFDVQRGAVSDRLQALPGPPTSSAMDAGLAYYDAEAMRVVFPVSDGSGLAPVATLLEDRLLLSSSRALADALLEAPPEETLTDSANLFVTLQPEAIGELLRDAGRVLAENDLLRDRTPESFELECDEWMERASLFDEVEAWFALREGRIEGEISISYGAS